MNHLSNKVIRVLVKLLVLLVALAAVFPFYWMIVTSLKTSDEVRAYPPSLFVTNPRWENYATVWKSADYPRYMLNSVFVTSVIFVLELATAILAGYAYAKLTFPGKNFFFLITLMCLMIPSQLRFVPVYVSLSRIGWIDTYLALIVPFAANAFSIFLMRQTFMAVPDDYIDAARIEGANTLQVIWSIMVPMSIPSISALGLLSFVRHWNEYFWPLVMTTSENVRTLPLGVAMAKPVEAIQPWHLIMAAGMLLVLPVLVVFAFAQKKIIRAFSYSTLK